MRLREVSKFAVDFHEKDMYDDGAVLSCHIMLLHKAARRCNAMEKYIDLLSNVADELTRIAAQDQAIAFDLESIKRIINAAEGKLDNIERL